MEERSHQIYNPQYANNYDVHDIENIFNCDMYNVKLTDKEMLDLRTMIIQSYEADFPDHKAYERFMRPIHMPKVKQIEGYRQLLHSASIPRRNINLEKYMRLKVARGNSGVVVITTFMSGTQFGDTKDIKRGGCPENCHYCPFERDENGIPTQPRSYLSNEPGNRRATQNKHHPLGQLFARASALEKQGHISPFPDVSSKIEVIISGGTFNFYPHDYVEWYVTNTYYALNVYYEYKITGELRPMGTLAEEIKLNETAALRMIGLTIETRPDRLLSDITNGKDGLDIVRFFRRLGVTRVQIGVQHTDDLVLHYVNRNCTAQQNMDGIKILKQNGFKTDIHLMLDLPMPPTQPTYLTYSFQRYMYYIGWCLWQIIYSTCILIYYFAISGTFSKYIRDTICTLSTLGTMLYDLICDTATNTINYKFNYNFAPEYEFAMREIEGNIVGVGRIPDKYRDYAIRDIIMIAEIIRNPNYQADQWKVYPTEVTPYTKILEWYEAGKYTPYAEWNNGKLLEHVIVYLKTRIPEYIRINRVVRDIPTESIYGGLSCPEMRSNILTTMKKMGKRCMCIRCREIKGDDYNKDDLITYTHEYISSGGREYYISVENADRSKLYGMVRVRINLDTEYQQDILMGCGLIRELHVYGIHSGVGDSDNITHSQHKGLGRQLLEAAEEIIRSDGLDHVVVISGVGVREYYRKFGYVDYHTYMIKTL